MRPEPTARRLTVLVVVVAVISFAGPATAWPTGPGASGPARGSRPSASRGGSILAVVVKSWGNCTSGGLIWDDLNANWSLYGPIPISIDYSNPGLCGDSFTLADLEASGADVVILSDPAGKGSGTAFTADEVTALGTYASEGHDLVGTFLTFAFGFIDNRALAPLFGLRRSNYGLISLTPTFHLKRPNYPLFRDLPHPYVSVGYDQSQVPGDGRWGANELLGTTGVAASSAQATAAIVVHEGLGYTSIYVSSMPEYGGGTEDEQFFYNAIVFPSL